MAEPDSVDSLVLNVKDHTANERLSLTFRNVCYRQKDGDGGRPKDIIRSVSGCFQPGRLVAILGPSGAGKSSLLSILSGLKQTGFIGTLEINGAILDRKRYRQQCVYIQQDFTLFEHLTVLETMNYAAELKMAKKSRSEMVRRKKVNDILRVLGLAGTMNTLVQKLSGGEKKRLSIGIEMVCNPPIILLDEPTSGLDSVAAKELISYVKTVAKEGRTVACVIHQPSSSLFQLFDDLYLLSAGRCIYRGPLDQMVDSFAEAGWHCPKYYNRADFALEVAAKSPNELDNLVQKFTKLNGARKQSRGQNVNELGHNVLTFEEDVAAKEPKPRTSQRYQIPQWQQFYVLLRRSLRVTSRDFFFAQLRVIAHILVGLLLGAVFYKCGQDGAYVMVNGACLFFYQLFIFFANSMPCVITFPLEAKVFVRERLNNCYSLEAYYLSKIVADLPLQIVCPSVFLAISYYMTEQPLEWDRFGMLWLVLLLLGIFAQTVGLLSGAAFNMQMATFFVPCFSIPPLLFSGFFVKPYEMNALLSHAANVSFFRYSMQGSLQAIYGNNRTAFPCSLDVCYYNKPKKFLKFMDTPEDGYWQNVYALLGFVLVFQIMLYVVLRLRLKIYQ